MQETKSINNLIYFCTNNTEINISNEEIGNLKLPLVFLSAKKLELKNTPTEAELSFIPKNNENINIIMKCSGITFIEFHNRQKEGRLEIFDVREQSSNHISQDANFWLLDSFYDSISIFAKEIEVLQIMRDSPC